MEDYSTLEWSHKRKKTDGGSCRKQETEDDEEHAKNEQSEKKQTEGENGKAIKKYTYFNFLPENLEKIHSTELNDAPLEGSTIFLYHSSLGHAALESCRLAELKYSVFSRTGHKTKK